MDIWNWVEKLQGDLRQAGQAQGAQLLTRLTDDVSDLRVERAQALLPEARALSKTLANPWLEVFVGHWEMRNRVGNLCEGERALGDAVALFERANREDTQQCPQSICVTQDLAACYGNMDGPGWAEERGEVCDETLSRIDPSWTCFQCLSCEKADALHDAGRTEEALAYLDQQGQAIEAHGGTIYDGLPEMRIKFLLDQGRGAEALALITEREAEINDGPEWANCSQPRQLQKALALAQLQRVDEALEVLPRFTELAPGYRRLWLKVVALIVKEKPEANTWDLGGRVQQVLEHFSQAGAHRIVVELSVLAADIALQRGSAWSARRHLALAQQHLPQLRQDLGASAQVQAMQQRIDANAVAVELPVPAAELLAWLQARAEAGNGRDPEREVEWLLQACSELPEHQELLETTASALHVCGADDQAQALLWGYVERHTDSDQPLAYRLLNLLLNRGELEQVRRLASLYRNTVPVMALWAEVQLAQRLGDWPELERACNALLELSPDSHGARSLLAQRLLQAGRFEESVAAYRVLTERMEEPRSAHWDLMTAASAAGDWASVRASAKAIGMQLGEGEGPIEEDFGWVIIRCIENGDALEYYARRTGPVTARIVENAPVNREQHVGDLVVFDAELVHPAPEDEEERKRFIPTYMLVHVLEPGGFTGSWLVDGAHPGEEAFEALRQRVDAEGWRLWVHSREEYRITDPQGGEEGLQGLLFTVAQPQGQPPQNLHRLLSEVTASWPHPMCWLNLAQACGDDGQAHMNVVHRYGL